MKKQLKTFLLSLLTPGLGYLQTGDRKSFYRTITLFFAVLILGAAFRMFTNFLGFATVLFLLIAIYGFATIHALLKVKTIDQHTNTPTGLKICFTLAFLLTTGLTFANRRTTMGFDIMSMAVPVMQPTLLQGDRFLVDTWTSAGQLERGAIVIHSFSGQGGLYLNRIVAVGGDEIEIKEAALFINGQAVTESYVLAANTTKPQSRSMQPTIVPHGHFFVMGDNRDASFGDSRFSGAITIKNIIGRATSIISSQDKSRIGATLQ